jgi:hypothetical protein
MMYNQLFFSRCKITSLWLTITTRVDGKYSYTTKGIRRWFISAHSAQRSIVDGPKIFAFSYDRYPQMIIFILLNCLFLNLLFYSFGQYMAISAHAPMTWIIPTLNVLLIVLLQKWTPMAFVGFRSSTVINK